MGSSLTSSACPTGEACESRERSKAMHSCGEGPLKIRLTRETNDIHVLGNGSPPHMLFQHPPPSLSSQGTFECAGERGPNPAGENFPRVQPHAGRPGRGHGGRQISPGDHQ